MAEAETPERSRGANWLLIAVGVIVIAALAFAIGRFTAFGASAAPVTPSNQSAEAGFARDMQVHHAQAVDMAMTIYGKTDDTELRTIAYDIATGQSAQRGQMYGWLVQWGLPQSGAPLMSWMTEAEGDHEHGSSGAPATEEELQAAMGMATAAELARLGAAEGAEADCLFLELMIRHHEGAIPMAEAVIELGTDPSVLTVARGMTQTQTAEIDAMQSAQDRLGCSG